MADFNGFSDSESFTKLPDTFFRELLPVIGDRAELKVTLFFLWQVQHMEGPLRGLKQSDFEEHAKESMGLTPDEVAYGLKKAVQRGTILKRPAEPARPGSAARAGDEAEQESEPLYFLNSPRGRAATQEVKKEEQVEAQEPVAAEPVPVETLEVKEIQSTPAVERPNLFALYEENIGPLTPMIADMLKDAEATYSEEWVAEALEIAVTKNIRNWKYVEAILKRWKAEHEGKDRKDAVKGSERYTQSEFEEYLNRK